MALRTPLSVTPHLYMGDSTGRPLDMGTVYFGEQDKDPEFYPIDLFSDDALTKPLAQPVHTKGGYLYDKGDMVEPHAKEFIYSVKVLDSYGRKVFYKGAMMRNSWNDDVIEQINTAIISSAGVARQVATDITNEAINNTAVEGGVLADTFVTMTPDSSTGLVARNLRDIRNDYVTPKNYGAIGDGITDDTIAFERAVQTGRSINLLDGKYLVKTNGIDLDGRDLNIFSQDNGELIMDTGSSGQLFNLVNCDSVKIKGVVLRSVDGVLRRIFNFTGTPYVKYFSVSYCSINVGVAVIRGRGVADILIDESIRYGFDEFHVVDNQGLYVNERCIVVQNVPVYKGVVSRNEIRNFSEVFAYFGNFGSDNLNAGRIASHNNIVVEGNTVTNDDDYFTLNTVTDYYSFILTYGGYSTLFKDNKISGMKVRDGSVALYDAYMTCQNVISTGNVYKNNANFSLQATHSYLMKAKQESTAEAPCIKIFRGNTYIIEDSWLDKIGLGRVLHRLSDLGAPNAGNVTIANNHIYLDLFGGSLKQTSDNVTITDNTLDIGGTLGTDIPPRVFVYFVASNSLSDIVFTGNNVNVRNSQSSFTLLRGAPNDPKWRTLVIHNNTTTYRNSSDNTTLGMLFTDTVLAQRAVITNNTSVGAITNTFYSSVFDDATIKDNNFFGVLPNFLGNSLSYITSKGITSNAYTGIASKFLIQVPSANATGMSGVYKNKVLLEVTTAQGVSIFSFSYSQEYFVDGISSITFTNSDDVVNTVEVTLSTETQDRIKITKESGEDINISAAFFRRNLGKAAWDVYGIPTNSIEYKVTHLVAKDA